jgi:hypothetical protein
MRNVGTSRLITILAGLRRPAPVSVVERRGQIGGVQVRNFIMPAMGKAFVMFTRRGDFAFGEVWRNAGFAYRALSAVGCA